MFIGYFSDNQHSKRFKKEREEVSKKSSHSSQSSKSSMISADRMWQLLDGLRNNQTREPTKRNYHQIWKQFNCFLIRLDVRPKLWESRVALFCAYLIEKGNKSSTIRSYNDQSMQSQE